MVRLYKYSCEIRPGKKKSNTQLVTFLSVVSPFPNLSSSFNSSRSTAVPGVSRLPDVRQPGQRAGEQLGHRVAGEVQQGEQPRQVLHSGKGHPRHQWSKYTTASTLSPQRPLQVFNTSGASPRSRSLSTPAVPNVEPTE